MLDLKILKLKLEMDIKEIENKNFITFYDSIFLKTKKYILDLVNIQIEILNGKN